jgi:hypothetical protein
MIRDELQAMYASVRKFTSSTHSIMLKQRPTKESCASDSTVATKPAAKAAKRPSAKRSG